MNNPAKILPLHLDREAAKQLDKVKRLTFNKTATKAIVTALYGYTEYKDKYNEALKLIDKLTLESLENKAAIRNFIICFNKLSEINDTKQNTKKGESTKGKKNIQLSIGEE